MTIFQQKIVYKAADIRDFYVCHNMPLCMKYFHAHVWSLWLNQFQKQWQLPGMITYH